MRHARPPRAGCSSRRDHPIRGRREVRWRHPPLTHLGERRPMALRRERSLRCAGRRASARERCHGEPRPHRRPGRRTRALDERPTAVPARGRCAAARVLGEPCSWATCVDCYGSIPPVAVERALPDLGVERRRRRPGRATCSAASRSEAFEGCRSGPAPSAVLANAVLAPVDRALARGGGRSCRSAGSTTWWCSRRVAARRSASPTRSIARSRSSVSSRTRTKCRVTFDDDRHPGRRVSPPPVRTGRGHGMMRRAVRTLYRAARVHTQAYPETGEWLLVDGPARAARRRRRPTRRRPRRSTCPVPRSCRGSSTPTCTSRRPASRSRTPTSRPLALRRGLLDVVRRRVSEHERAPGAAAAAGFRRVDLGTTRVCRRSSSSTTPARGHS